MRRHTAVVLDSLADGEFHSGVALALRAGVTRASVWNAVREIESMGLAVVRARGRGYRLERPVSLLDPAAIERELAGGAPALRVELHASVDSTNAVALRRAGSGAPAGTVVAAEWQSAGRGRRGRSWRAGLAGALMFSLIWRHEKSAGALSGLSLAVGVALVHGLAKGAGLQAALKWPNDVLAGGGKLGGILIELAGDALGPGTAVIGVGLNIRLPAALRRAIEQPATDVESVTGRATDRNALLACLLVEIDAALARFAADGFAPFRAEWERCHAHQGRPVSLSMTDGRIETGIAAGVAEDGSLVLETPAGVKRFHSGEVSLRSDRETSAG